MVGRVTTASSGARAALAKLALALLAAACAAACASAARPTPPAVRREPPAAPATRATAVLPDDNLNAVLWTQGAVEHDLAFRALYRAAQERLEAALADTTWDALPREEREGPLAPLPPAVIVDVDETVLDNSPYQALMVETGDEYADTTWAEWCRKEAARALPGAAEFARFAAERGVVTYYVTNRAAALGPATLANLRKAGFPVPGDHVFLGLGMAVDGCTARQESAKGCRRRLVGRGHRVLMMFGDQAGDFVDVAENTPTGRAASLAPYAEWIGQRWWVLPNPTYGSWEPAAFGNDWSLPREERRRRKIEALRLP
jgi:acid phosphatase